MSYEIGRCHDGGFDYRVTVNGLIMNGWRRGTRAQVEEYARKSAQMCADRAMGAGFIRLTKNNKASTSHLRGGRKTAAQQSTSNSNHGSQEEDE